MHMCKQGSPIGVHMEKVSTPPPIWRSAGAVKVKSTTGKTIALMISGQSAARLTVRYEQLLVRLASWIAPLEDSVGTLNKSRG